MGLARRRWPGRSARTPPSAGPGQYRGAVGRWGTVERPLADPGPWRLPPACPGPALYPGPRRTDLRCVDLDVPGLDLAGSGKTAQPVRLRPRRRGFAEEVLRAYAYQCAMCGFDGALGRYPVGIEAAHVRGTASAAPT